MKRINRLILLIYTVIYCFAAYGFTLPLVYAEDTMSEFVYGDVFYENFNEGHGKFSPYSSKRYSAKKSVYTNNGYPEGTGGAVTLQNVVDYNSIHATVNIDSNRKYKVSFWVKGVNNYSNKKAVLVLNKVNNHKNSIGGNSVLPMDNYRYVGLDNGKPLTNSWHYVEEIISFSKSGITDEVGTTDLFFSAYMTNTPSTTVSSTQTSFCVDEIKIEPLDIIDCGDMSDISGYFFNNSSMAYTSKENENDVLVLSNKDGGNADACRTVDIREGETYRISYRAKTLYGENKTQVLFSRNSKLYAVQSAPLYESVQEDTVNSEWQTFSHIYKSSVVTTDTVAYRYPEMIFRVKQEGCVYIDDLCIEKINNDITDVKLSGECKSGKNIEVSFKGNGSSQYKWLIIDPKFYKVIQNGIITSEHFTFEMPNKESIILCIVPYDKSETGGYCTYINNIKLNNFTVNEVTENQKIGTEFPDTVWTPDFSTVRAIVTVENKSENLNGVLAVYDKENGCLKSVDFQRLNDGENILSANSADGNYAKVMVINEKFVPKINFRTISKDEKSHFIYVEPNGSKLGKGTFDKPVNLTRAMSLAKSQLSASTNDVCIMLKSDEYKITNPIELTSEYSGINGDLVICSWGGTDGKKAQISGGREISGWECYDEEKNIYRSKVPEDIVNFRQLYINGIRAVRARTNIAPLIESKTGNGYILKDTSLVGINNVADAEFAYYYEWTNPRCGISSVTDNGDGTSTVVMDDFCWTQFLRKKYLEPTAPAYIENAYEFLNTKGEWYFDKNTHFVYYMPRDFEDVDSMDAVVPNVETLVSVKGTYSAPVKNITFKNVEFAYSTWLYPDTFGYSDAQAGKLRDRLDENGNGDDPCPDAAVEVTHAENVNFEDCTFCKLGMSALSMLWGVKDSHIIGNSFGDLSGSGIYLGTPYKDGICTDWHNDICENITVENNYFHDIGIDYKSCVAISTIHMYDTNINHNEIFNISYSGIHGESGINVDRTGHKYNYNYINMALNSEIYDGASIYVTGKSGADTSPWNEISGNYIKNQMNAHAGLYTDNKSSGWNITNNVIDFSKIDKWPKGSVKWYMSLASEKVFLNNNFVTTDAKELHTNDYWKGQEASQEELITNTHIDVNAEWNQEAAEIISNSGLSDDYDARLTDKYQITLSNDKKITLKKGMSYSLELFGEGGKCSGFKQKDDIVIVPDDSNVVCVQDNKIVGKNIGSGQIEVYTYADGCMKSISISVEVY